MPQTTRWLLLLALAFALGCSGGRRGSGSGPNDDDSADGSDDDDLFDDDDSGGTPELVLAWPSLDGFSGDPETSEIAFGTVTTGDLETVPLTLANPGTGALAVCELSLARLTFSDGELDGEVSVASDPEIALVVEDASFVLAAGDTLDVDLRYTPLYGTPLASDLHLVVRHALNWDCAADSGDGLYVPVSGDGWGDPQPDVYAKPNAVQFADVLVGEESDWQDVVVGNAGPGLLEIASVSLDGDTHFELDAGSVASD